MSAGLAYLEEHRAYLGTSGSGKSTTARGHVELLLLERRHVCITDHTGVWYGLRSNAAGTGPGFDIPIFGGRKGDVPIGAGDGSAIGKIVGDGVSAIVDLSALRTGYEQRVFMRDFVRALRAKPAGHFQLVADEADEDVPEKTRDSVHFELAEDMIWIAKRGRSDGFVLSLITQRTASIANEALAMAKTIFAHQLISPADTGAFGRYVKAHGTAAEFKEIMARLPTLQTGERYVYSPQLHVLELGTSPMPATFDSSRTPGPGETRREPKLLSQIDVAAIAAALKKPDATPAEPMAAFDAGAAAGELLRQKDARIRELEEELAAARQLYLQYRGAIDDAQRFLSKAPPLPNPHRHDGDHPGSAGTARDEAQPSPPRASRSAGEEGAPRAASTRPASASSASQGGANERNLNRGRKALPALLANPDGLTEKQWAWVAGFSPGGGTWGTYKSELRGAGLVVEMDGKWFTTPAGTAVAAEAGDPNDCPKPGPDLARFWGGKISGVRKMVDVLIRRWPTMITRELLAAEVGMAASGGTFGTYLSRLRTQRLVEEDSKKKKLRLAPELMGEAN